MELYVLRHGIAEEQSATGRDEDRALTAEGRKKLREVLRAAARAGVRPGVVLTSPLLRAVQTARIAAEELGYTGALVTSEALVPDGRPEDVWSDVRAHRDVGQVLLASHNPLCGELTGYLLRAPELWVDFKKGALLRVDFDQVGVTPRGVLRWFLAPKLVG